MQLWYGNVPHHNCISTRLPEDESSGSKQVEDIKINLENMQFIGLYCIITLQYTVKKVYHLRSGTKIELVDRLL
jgi:hypothetical protein